MASLLELYELSSDGTLISKITAAIAVLAETIRIESESGSPPTDVGYRMSWAMRALQNPDGEARKIIWLLLAQNKALTKAQILGANDTAIQNAVNGAISLFK